MNCKDIEKHLSAFIDNALDDQVRPRVENHIASCNQCSEKLSALRSVSKALGDLPAVKAPSDFMERLHKRIESESPLKKLFKTLFVPFRIKIPIEFATAAVLGVLVFFVITTTQQEMKQLPISSMDKESFEVAAPQTKKADAMIVQKDEVRQETIMAKSAPSPAKVVQNEPIELALVIMPKGAGRAQMQPVEMEYAADLKEDAAVDEKRKMIEMPVTGLSLSEKKMARSSADDDREGLAGNMVGEEHDEALGYYAPAVTAPENIMEQVKALVEQLNGRIEDVSDDEDSGQYVTAAIPAAAYDNLINQLKTIADFKIPPPEVSIIDSETIRMNISIEP